jgi:transcriptional regulator with XRE-family HTH domain
MAFAETLQLLRKERGWTQEQLAAQIHISRQALSKWEVGSAMPDIEHIIRLSKLFGVSTDYLLLGIQEQSLPPSAQEPSRPWEAKVRIILGVCLSSASLLGLLILGVLSSVFPAVYAVSPVNEPWTRVYTGLWGFLKTNRLQWLFLLLLLLLLTGLGIICYPRLKQWGSRLRRRLPLQK